MISEAPIKAAEIAKVYNTDCGLGIVEFHNGAMCLADVDDLEEFGEAFRVTNTVRFPEDMSIADRIAAMRAKVAA